MELMANKGSVQGIGAVPDDMREVFVTAHDIEPAQQVRMQSIFQEHVDNAVSKTINLPESSTIEDVRMIYRWRMSFTARASPCTGKGRNRARSTRRPEGESDVLPAGNWCELILWIPPTLTDDKYSI